VNGPFPSGPPGVTGSRRPTGARGTDVVRQA